jgi:hypothetical protein
MCSELPSSLSFVSLSSASLVVRMVDTARIDYPLPQTPSKWTPIKQSFSEGETAWLNRAVSGLDTSLYSEDKLRRDASCTLQQTATQTLEWAALKRWERDYEFQTFRFACDRKHVCWNDNQGESTIITVSAALRFFGCRECGRSHICRGRWDNCIKVLTEAGEYICAFSGQFIDTESSIGTYDGECRMIALQKEQSITFGGESIEGMQSQGNAMSAIIKDSRDWIRQDERQKRQREKDEEMMAGMFHEMDEPEMREPSAKRARKMRTTLLSDTVVAASSSTLLSKNYVAKRDYEGDGEDDASDPALGYDEKGDLSPCYPDEDDENHADTMDIVTFDVMDSKGDNHTVHSEGTKWRRAYNSSTKKPIATDKDHKDTSTHKKFHATATNTTTAAAAAATREDKDIIPSEGADITGNGSGDGTAGDYDASAGGSSVGGEREVGGGETRITTSNARMSGVNVGAWSRNTDRLMRYDHNLDALDASRVSASFLQHVTLELNTYDTMERALHAFDKMYADELALERQFGAASLTDEDSGSGNEQSPIHMDTSGEENGVATSSSSTSSSMDITTSLEIERPLNTQRAYKRALHKVKQSIENDMRTIVQVLSDVNDDRITVHERCLTYVNFGMRLFRVLVHADPVRHTPSRLAHIGVALMLELLADKFVIIDTVAGSNYKCLIWNADEWLSRLKDSKMFDLLLIEDARRNKQENRRTAARQYAPHQLQRIQQFREQYVFTRAQVTTWVASTRKLLIQVASTSPHAFHAALFSCSIQ